MTHATSNARHLITPEEIDAVIIREDYYQFPGTMVTVCILELRNGAIVVGDSSTASPEELDPDVGRKLSRVNARGKIWALEGYLLREKLRLSGAKA